MKVTPKIYFTPNGKEITIRQAVPTDARQLLELKKAYIKDTTTIPLYVYEYKNDLEQEKQLIERYITEGNSLLLIALHGNTVIGNIDVNGSQREKLYHTAMIGMGVAYEWHNHKIGSFLMQRTLQWATKNTALKLIWLEVYSTNTAGIKLYEKYNFEKTGVIRDFVNDKKLIDKITMVNYI